MVYLGVSSQEQDYRAPNDQILKNVLTDKNTREITLDNMAADLRRLVKENKKLRQEIDNLKDEVDRKDYNAGVKIDPQVLRNQLNNLNKELNKQKEQIRQLEARKFPRFSYDQNESDFVDLSLEPTNTTQSVSSLKDSEPQIIATANDQKEEPISDLSNISSQAPREESYSLPSFAVVEQKKPEVNKSQNLSNVSKSHDYKIYLPAGSILSGVLLNGLDAPTGAQARKEPFPAVVRIQKDAILPNQYKSDIRECFLIVSGFGDLSSERAYLRGETLSCIDSNHNFVEGSLNSYAVGDDGKAGIRGRLVSKQGQIIAKSLMAGFLSGLAEVFDVDAVPTINTSSSGKVSYEHVYSASALQGAATKGISNSLEKIADFYIKMAEGLYPVIEIDAGRSIDIVVSRGSEISLKDQAKEKDARKPTVTKTSSSTNSFSNWFK